MGHVKEQRAIKLLEKALLEYLEDGNIPTTGELETSYNAAEKEHGNLARSAVSRVSLPTIWQESSASEFNSFLDNLTDDLSVLFKALAEVSNNSILSLSEWSSRAAGLETRLNKLIARCDSLLVTKNDTAGYVSFVEDGFYSLENVSESGTTAFVDTDNGEVTLGVDKTVGNGAALGTAINFDGAKVSLEIINRETLVKSSSTPNSQSLQNLLNITNQGYNFSIETYKEGSSSITLELKVSLPEAKDINKISLMCSNVSNVSVTLQYSKDGYRWELIDSDISTQSGVGNFVFRFAKTEMQYFKFIIVKSSPDSVSTTRVSQSPLPFSNRETSQVKNVNIFSFSFQEIKAFSQEFPKGPTGEDLYTELRYPQLGGNNISFARAALEVCEDSPTGCSIDYYLRAYDGTSYTNWIKIIPLNRKKVESNLTTIGKESGYAVVDFSTPQSLNSEDLTTKFSSSLNVEALNLERDYGSTGLTYRLSGANDTFANFYIPTSLSLISDVVLMRNYGDNTRKFPTLTSDKTVRDVSCGWGLIGDGTYYCAFYVSNPEGLSLDFGPSTAIIDGRVVSGKIEPGDLLQGWHVFKTSKANWISLSGASNPTSLAALKALDPLYPYNHKYIIEGFNYSSSFSNEEKVYLGVDRYCQYCSAIETTSLKQVGSSTRIGIFDFFDSGLDYSTFALDEISTNKTILLLKVDSGKVDQQNERVRLFYTRRYESFSAVELRVNLKTDEINRSPVLSYYRIKVK